MLQLRKILLHNRLYIIIFIIVITITITRLSIKKTSIYSENTHSISGIITSINYDDDKINMILKGKEKVAVTYYSKENIKLSLGDKIKVIGTFSKPSNNTTKYLFNYNKYLKRNNIYFLVKSKKIIKLKDNSNIYYYIKNIIIKHLGNNPYLNTFLLGDKYLINRASIRSYQENGISHLFAISGMHISLIASIANKILKNHFSEEESFKIISIILIIYLLLVGFSPSILRGVLFYILFTANKTYYFYIKSTSLFLLIISLSLLVNPNYIYDVGFQYSYLISFTLLSLSDKISSNNYFFSLLKVSIVSFIASIPISLYNFYQLNLLSISYNLIYVPLISIIIFPFSIVVFFIKPLEPIYNLLILFLEKSSIFLSKINIGKLIFKRLPMFIYVIYFILIILYLLYKKRVLIIIFLLLIIVHYFIPYFDKSKYIEFIDQTTPNMIQRISGIFEINPLISKEI